MSDVHELIAAATGDPAIHLAIVQTLAMEDLHVMGFAVMTSPSAEEALRRACRYSRLVNDAGAFEMERVEGELRFRWVGPFPDRLGARTQEEARIAAFLHHVRHSSRREVVPLSVSFRHEAPADLGPYRRFFRCPIRFAAPEAGFVLDATVMEGVVPRGANPAMSTFFARIAEAMLEKRGDGGVAARVREAIVQMLVSGEPSSVAVARRLAMSERSLRRELQREGTTFRDLLDDVRRARAEALIRSGQVAITDIAFLLGFSETSAFSRAFRRWHGCSPRSFRHREAVD
jgi:AraC-like DNA-binding protein